MTYKLWRQVHLWLAALSFPILLVLVLSGLTLSLHTSYRHITARAIDGWESQDLGKTVQSIHSQYEEPLTLSINNYGEISLQYFSDEGEETSTLIHPTTAESIGEAIPQSEAIEWMIFLHRSLLLHGAGRIIVGVITLLCLLTLISGVALILKRKGFAMLWSFRYDKGTRSMRYHIGIGRLLLLPMLVLFSAACFLFFQRIGVLPSGEETPRVKSRIVASEGIGAEQVELRDATLSTNKSKLVERSTESLPSAFTGIPLGEVEQLDFPLLGDDEEPYRLKLHNCTLVIEQATEQILSTEDLPSAQRAKRLALSLHTGSSSLVWSIILGISTLAVFALMITGLLLLLQRTRCKRKTA